MNTIDLMMWMQTIIIGVNTVVLLLLATTTIKWVMSNEKERNRNKAD